MTECSQYSTVSPILEPPSIYADTVPRPAQCSMLSGSTPTDRIPPCLGFRQCRNGDIIHTQFRAPQHSEHASGPPPLPPRRSWIHIPRPHCACLIYGQPHRVRAHAPPRMPCRVLHTMRLSCNGLLGHCARTPFSYFLGHLPETVVFKVL